MPLPIPFRGGRPDALQSARSPPRYQRHQPETTLLYQIVEQYYPAFLAHLAHQAGFTKREAPTGAVTLIQRFGSALNLNIHFHMLFLDGVYVQDGHGHFGFRKTPLPTVEQLHDLLHRISQRVARFLERRGILERDEESSYLNLDGLEEDPLSDIHGYSVTYRVAIGPQQGRKVFTLQTIPPQPEPAPDNARVAKLNGFSLHAGVAAKAHQRQKVERLCRYIARPAVSEKRLSLASTGKVRYELKTPFRNGTTHVIFEPLDFLARLAALVPKPRVNLTRCHGVFAPNSKHRAAITPSGRGRGGKRGKQASDNPDDRTPTERHTAMTWALRLKRVFSIDIESCEKCQGPVKIIACIEDPVVIRQILEHLQKKESIDSRAQLPPGRAPPQLGLFD